MAKAELNKPKQTDLPGLEQREIEAIVQAAERYRETRDERMRLSKLEGEQKELLIEVMRKHNRTTYNYRGLFVSVTTEIGIKVKAKDEDENVTPKEARRQKANLAEVTLTTTPELPELTTEESKTNALSFFGRKERNADELATVKSPLDVYVSQEELATYAKTNCYKSLPKKKATISKTFQLGEELYVCVNAMINATQGGLIENLLAYRMVRKEEYQGDLVSYEDTKATGNLHGLLVYQRGWEYVLTGPPIIFRDRANLPPEDDIRTEDEKAVDAFAVAPLLEKEPKQELRNEDYVSFVIAHREGKVTNPASKARKLQLSGDKDDEIRAWLARTEESEPPEDDFTAEQCSECDRIDGAHDVNCTQHPDYVAPKPVNLKRAKQGLSQEV